MNNIGGSSDLPDYIYQTIKGNSQLRILTLQGAQRHDAALVCSLETIDAKDTFSDQSFTDDNPSSKNYEALSWCWGDQPRDRALEMYHDGEAYKFMITKNLDEALRGLRLPSKVRHLWVDFLCINQADKNERNEQVPQMRMIYGGARSVCVWVGPGDDTTEDAFKFIWKLLNVWDFDEIKNCENIQHLLTSFWRLVNQPWFSRRWVVQEIALARQATLYCGDKSIGWADFADAVSLFVVNESASQVFSTIMTDSKNIRDAFSNASEMGAAILIEATGTLFRVPRVGLTEPLLSLEYLISKFTVFEARQPRDTIYALLAISKDTTAKLRLFKLLDLWEGDLLGRTSPAVQLALRALGRRKIASRDFKVDYNEPIIEVYQRFIQFSIERSESTRALDILCRPWAPRFTGKDEKAGFHEALNGSMNFTTANASRLAMRADSLVHLPSWVGTQDQKPFAMKTVGGSKDAFRKMHRTNADPLVGHPISGQRPYTANGSLELRLDDVKFKKSDSAYSMLVKGFIIDEVNKVEDTSQDGMIPATWLSTGGWRSLVDPPPDDLWRTLVANRGPNSDNAPPFYKRACKEAFQGLRRVDNLNTSDLIAEGGSSIVMAFLKRVQAVTWRRSLIRSSDGRLGLVYSGTRKGDFICILDGCSVPVILRQHKKELHSLQKDRAQVEKDSKDRLKRAVILVGEMREQQLIFRSKSIAWQQKQKWLRCLRWARVSWLMLGPGAYLCSRPQHDSIMDVCLIFLALSATSTHEMRVLGPRPVRRMSKWWWDLTEQPPIAALLLITFIGMYSANACRVTTHLWIAVAISTLLFPALLLRPLALQDTFSERNLQLMINKPRKLATELHRDLAAKASGFLAMFSPQNWKLPSFRALSQPKTTSIQNDDGGSSSCCWKLIGPAYIHGIMDGEAINLRNRFTAEITEALTNEKKEKVPLSDRIKELQRKKYAQRQTFELR